MGIGDHVNVDTGVVKAHVDNLHDALTQFGHNADEFDSAMTDMLHKSMGGAEVVFKQLHTQWMESADHLKNDLHEMGVKTEDVAAAFEHGQQQQHDEAQAAAGQINLHQKV